MRVFAVLSSVVLVAVLLGACKTPSDNAFGNRDARNSKPFWELNDQRDN